MDAGARGMTVLPISHYLTDLSGGEPARRGGRGLAAIAQDGQPDVQTQLRDAHARGILEGRAAAKKEHEATANAQAAYFEQRVNFERQKWTAEEGQHLADQFIAALEELERRIALRLSDVLNPFLHEEISRRAMDEIVRTLNDLLSKGEYAKIVISGPSDLLSVMEERVGGSHDGLSFIEASKADVTIRADETILETHITAWVDAIRGDR
jgi:hypothetical protein